MSTSEKHDGARDAKARAAADKMDASARKAEAEAIIKRAEADAARDWRAAAEAHAGSAGNATVIQTIVDTLPNRDFMADMLASITTSNAALAAPALHPTGVSIRMQRTIESFGFPSPRELSLRPQQSAMVLRDVLPRSYSVDVQKGFTSYRRVDRLAMAAPTAAAGDGPALRGIGLVQVEMLRAYRVLLLQLLDDLEVRDEALHARIARYVDELITLAAAPLGPTSGQSEGRFRRLALAVVDWLDGCGVADGADLRGAIAHADIRRLLEALKRPISYVTAGPVVPTRETAARIAAVRETLREIGTIATASRKDDIGRSGAELEQAMTLLCASAAQLQAELERLGTSADEQEIAFFGRYGREVSIAQFTRWLQDVCAAFATGDDEAPTLRRDDLAVLVIDLKELVVLAKALESHGRTYAAELRLIGARRQMKEVSDLLTRAQHAAEAMLAPASF